MQLALLVQIHIHFVMMVFVVELMAAQLIVLNQLHLKLQPSLQLDNLHQEQEHVQQKEVVQNLLVLVKDVFILHNAKLDFVALS